MSLDWLWRDLAATPWIAPLINHLWQSTAVALAAGLLTLALRGNRAGVRYWLWFIASMSFLFPFSMLVAAGGVVRPAIPAAAQENALAPALVQIAEPFSPAPPSVLSGAGPSTHWADVLPALLVALWACGAIFAGVRWLRSWLKMQAAVRDVLPHERISAAIPVLSTQSLLEPGIYGIAKPVLLLPAGIEDRLTRAQLHAIVAHEMCHVLRRDNLTYALHLLVQTLFWFHPLVWFIGSRLIDERERACDEATLESGNDSEVYAEGILNVCRFFIESPAACVSGVSGSDLKKRIVRILSEPMASRLGMSRKILLGAAGFAAIAVPTAIGIFHASQTAVLARAQDAPADIPKFDVVSIKPNKSGEMRIMMMFKPDGISMNGVTAQMILRQAFNVENDRIVGAPSWVTSDRFDAEAKVAPEDAPKLDKLKREQRFMMLQPLLEDRFHLKFHHETRELPIYALVIAKGGSKLKQSEPDSPSDEAKAQHSTLMMGMGNVQGTGSGIDSLVHVLSTQVGRTIVDKTGLTGMYDYTLKWTPDDMPMPGPAGPAGGSAAAPAGGGPPPPDASGPGLFTALQEQLGLKLESEKGPVDVIVIDHIDKPSEN